IRDDLVTGVQTCALPILSDEVIRQYGGRLRKLSEEEGLWPFDRTAVAAMIEYGVRKAGRRSKVTARFTDLADLGREACYVAREEIGRASGREGGRGWADG